MKFKVIRQLDDSVTVEFYNSKNEKIDYEILDVKKDGLGYMYKIKGLRIHKVKPKGTGKAERYVGPATFMKDK